MVEKNHGSYDEGHIPEVGIRGPTKPSQAIVFKKTVSLGEMVAFEVFFHPEYFHPTLAKLAPWKQVVSKVPKAQATGLKWVCWTWDRWY